jgi:hypothetical protein
MKRLVVFIIASISLSFGCVASKSQPRLEPNIQMRDDVLPARLVEAVSPSALHSFGGKAVHEGAVPKGQTRPLHLLFLLDTQDPRCPISCSTARYVPLYYPLIYDGGELEYLVKSDKEIEIISMYGCDKSLFLDSTSYPKGLPAKQINIEPLTYEEYRAILMNQADSAFKLNDDDKSILKRIGGRKLVRIGGDITSLEQGDVYSKCQNKKCPLFGEFFRHKSIVHIPNEPVKGIKLFSDFGDYTEFIFSVCRGCGAIFATNRCD